MSLTPVRIYGAWAFFLTLLGLFLTAVGVAFLKRYDPSPDDAVSTIVIVALVGVAIFIVCVKYFYEHVHGSSQNDWLASLRFARTANHVTLPTHIPRSQREFPGSTAIAPPLPVPKIAGDKQPYRLTILPDPHPPKHPDRDPAPTRIVASGIIPSTFVPTVLEPNRAAEISGITNRVLVDVSEPLEEEINAYYDYVLEHPNFTVMNDIRADDSDAGFEKWVKRYPLPRQEAFRAARLEVQAGYNPSMRGRSFVKLEKAVKISEFGEAKTRPRIVTGFEDGIMAMTGPYINDYTNQFAARWSQPPIIYTRGMTAEQIARHAYDFVDRCPGELVIIENDFRVMDATVRQIHIEPHERRWLTAGAGPATLNCLMRPLTIDLKTRHGLKVQAPRQVTSGEATTNLTDTAVNGGAVGSWVEKQLQQQTINDFLLFVMGDDGLLLMSVPLMNESDSVDLKLDLINSFEKHLTNLGFKPEAQLRELMSESTFCSKLFWPSLEGPVLAPMPGRILARLGWNLTQSGAANLRGAAESLKRGCSHIPFLRLYIKRTIELTSGQKSKTERRSEEWTYAFEKYHSPSRETWAFFFERYGLGEAQEIEFGKALNQITALPCVIENESMAIIIAKDC
jgi:hypothetical protein